MRHRAAALGPDIPRWDRNPSRQLDDLEAIAMPREKTLNFRRDEMLAPTKEAAM
jgi:hypothetical protein